MDTFMVKITV